MTRRVKNYFYEFLDSDKKFTYVLFTSTYRKGSVNNLCDCYSAVYSATGKSLHIETDYIYLDNAQNRYNEEVDLDPSRIIDCR